MENRPRFVLLPSLEQMALRKIAIAWYSDPRILASIATLRFVPNGDRNVWLKVVPVWGKISKYDWRLHVKDTASALKLPESLRTQMVTALKAVGNEIVTWELVHREYLGTSISGQLACLRKLCWTSAGTVDCKRTAERLVACHELDIAKRFELACLYCLEDAIHPLWAELPDEDKRTFCDKEVSSRFGTPRLQLLLPSVLKKQSEVQSDVHYWRASSTNSFEKAALCGNRILAEFCFRNLTKEEREASLVRTARNLIWCRGNESSYCDLRQGKLTDVLCYLLSLMTPEEQVGIFRELSFRVLRCFLDWPWQDLFLDIADAMWAFLTENDYTCLVHAIYKSIYASGYYYPNVFQDLFLRGPREFRKRLVDVEIERGRFLSVFSRNEDKESIRVMLGSMDAADRVRLALSEPSVDRILQPSIKWHVVETFLRAATLSKADKQRLREDVVALLKRCRRIEGAREKHGGFFEFVEEC